MAFQGLCVLKQYLSLPKKRSRVVLIPAAMSKACMHSLKQCSLMSRRPQDELPKHFRFPPLGSDSDITSGRLDINHTLPSGGNPFLINPLTTSILLTSKGNSMSADLLFNSIHSGASRTTSITHRYSRKANCYAFCLEYPSYSRH